MSPKVVQERLDELAVRVHQLASPLVQQPTARNAVLQVIRSSSGMAMNYSSASVARSHAEFTCKLGVVLEESVETLKWLNYLRRCGLVEPELLAGPIKEGSELVAMFRAGYRTATSNRDLENRRRRSRRPDRDVSRTPTLQPDDRGHSGDGDRREREKGG